MGKQTFDRIKRTLSIFMAIFCLVSVTATIVSAADYGKTSGNATMGGATAGGCEKTSGGATIGGCTTAGGCEKTVGSSGNTIASDPPIGGRGERFERGGRGERFERGRGERFERGRGERFERGFGEGFERGEFRGRHFFHGRWWGPECGWWNNWCGYCGWWNNWCNWDYY